MKQYRRLGAIPPYIFADLDRQRDEMIRKGIDIIDISIGDPDTATPDFILEALCEGLTDTKNFRYPPYEGTLEFRKSVANYYKRRFGVELDPVDEVVALIGSKEGIAHLGLAIIDYGDIALIPDPGYPIYNTSVCMAGGIPYIMPLKEDKGYLPKLDGVSNDIAQRAKLIFINYPNNPTGAVGNLDTYKSIIKFAVNNDIIICNDAAYNELVYDGVKPVSILSLDDARKVAIELGTLSKPYNMTGWRIGYAVGNKEILKKLMRIKSNTDSGQFGAIQHAASAALNNGDKYIEQMRGLYQNRRDNALNKLLEAGIDAYVPKGSFYIWFKTPNGYTSCEYAARLAGEQGIIVTPGTAFGIYGEGYCRVALTVEENVLNNAIDRIKCSNINNMQ